tara:strand:- start:473 stop:847 length:375 start_codon:yes stop_codon:yes gene_type:complete
MDIILYNKKNALQEKYSEGEVNQKALKIAHKFYELCYHKFKITYTESSLFNLFVKTFNSYARNNLDTQMKNNDEFIDAINMFDDILIALSSKNGLNLCQVFLCLEPCKFEAGKVKHKKYLEWNY